MAGGLLVEPGGSGSLTAEFRRECGRAPHEAAGAAGNLAAATFLEDDTSDKQAPALVDKPSRCPQPPAINGSQKMLLEPGGQHEDVGLDGTGPR